MLYLLPLNLETIRINQKTGNLPPLCLLIIPVRTGTSHETRERDVYVCLAGGGRSQDQGAREALNALPPTVS